MYDYNGHQLIFFGHATFNQFWHFETNSHLPWQLYLTISSEGISNRKIYRPHVVLNDIEENLVKCTMRSWSLAIPQNFLVCLLGRASTSRGVACVTYNTTILVPRGSKRGRLLILAS